MNEEGGGIKDENVSSGIVGINERATDYVDLVTDNYLMNIASPASQELGITLDESEAQRVQNGEDLFFHNDYLAYNSLTDDALKNEFKAAVKANNLNNKIQVLINQINNDFKKEGMNFSSTNPVQFR
jgi:hypothetical protein